MRLSHRSKIIFYQYSIFFLPALLIVILAGCTNEELSTEEINTLDPQKAAEQAANIEDDVPVELAEGFQLSLWASEELISDPVGLDVDNKGRLFVTNTTRSWSSEFDIRNHRDWMDEAMTWSTVEDRRDFLHRELAPERSDENESWLPDRNEDGSHDWKDLTVQKEKVYRVDDQDGDGVADRSQLFIEDFHSEVTDVAGAILSFRDNVYLGVAPDMWRLKDTDGDGMADEKESISHGYGIHIGFSGHGMSGATYGPDGRIYWGIGDIGFNGKSGGKHWKYPNRGIIARSDPDGSNFEVFAMGVRNTFEFSFDKYGNLISVDNDGDHAGESERLVYLVKGSDSGWRHNWQFGKYDDPNNNPYKVWMDEEMYKPRQEGQAAYFIPPIANYHNGPAGMAYNPGTALSEKWNDHFFVAEYTGSTARSRIHAFTLKQSGAGFELETDQVVEQGILATGMDFGPDGALYFADWIEGWQTNSKGRIWKLDTPATADAPIRKETKQILAEEFDSRSEEELLELLGHRDMRVRMKAQFELADRGDTGGAQTFQKAIDSDHQLTRLHGIWGIGQLARDEADFAKPLIALLDDGDPEVRAQAARVIGDVQYEPAGDRLISLLEDEQARPRFFAAQALGELAYEPAIEPVIKMLETNNDEDVYLRHAGTLALAQIGQADPILALEDHPSRALRIAAVVALRRMEHPGVARFLDDEDEYIVTEAARAINDDWSIEDALPDLAAILEQNRFGSEALLRRAINANLRIGGPEATKRLADYAVLEGAPDSMRVEAISTLGVWSNPPQLDRVTGRYRGQPDLDPAHAREALAAIIDPLLDAPDEQIRLATIRSISSLDYQPAIEKIFTRLQDDASPEVRVAALNALQVMNFNQIERAIEIALDDQSQQVRMTALSLTPTLELTDRQIVDLLSPVLGKGEREEQQVVLETLGEMNAPPANKVLAGQLQELAAGNYPGELQLDLILAARASNSDTLSAFLEQYESSKPNSSGDVVTANRELLYGGNAEAGRELVFGHEAAQCMRCHAVGGDGGSVGPDLANIGTTLSREQILESLIAPNERIAPGYGSVSVTLEDGEEVSGVVREETDAQLVLQSADGTTRTIEKNSIAEQESAPSSMPPMGTILEKHEIRDMVEFLSTLKGRGQ